jgi:3-deoxy-D-manno-octulosonic acid kinase
MNIVIKAADSYVIGSIHSLTDEQVSALCKLCEGRPYPSNGILSGRGSVTGDHIDGFGAIIVKHYRRGGLRRHLINRWYFNLGITRCRREFELLHHVKSLGINVPEPVAFVYRGTLLYRAWLLTREVPQSISLAHLAARQENRAQRIMPAVIEQMTILIQNKVLHVDLHPGNVLVDNEDTVFLVDFDKGCFFSGNTHALRDRYLNRWRRAAIKHKLPTMLYEMLRKGLAEI